MIRASWNSAPWASKAMRIAACSNTTSFADVVERLRAIAVDLQADPEEAHKAEAMLKTISLDQNEPQVRRSRAYAASQRVEAKLKLDDQMGLRRRATIRHEGTRAYFPAMTPEEARAALARKAGR